MICTCTNIESTDKERPAYTELLYFWKVLLNVSYLEKPEIKEETPSQQKDEDDIEAEDLYNLYTDMPSVASVNLPDALYDSFIVTFKYLISTFNLNLKKITETSNEEASEATENFNVVSKSLQPINQKDFILFQNLVEFWCALLKEVDNARLTHWIYILSSTMIDHSVMNPLVSGFYRIIAEVLAICEKNQFFKGCNAFVEKNTDRADKNIQSMVRNFLLLFMLND